MTGQRLRQWSFRIFEFGVAQGFIQLLNAVAGFLIVRSLTKDDYALYAIAASMMAPCYLLAELGTGMGYQSLAGKSWNDRGRLGALLDLALRMRLQFGAASFTACTAVAAWLLLRNGANPAESASLCLSMVAGAAPIVGSSLYVFVPQLLGEYRRIQSAQLSSALARCLLVAGAVAAGLGAVAAMLANAAANWVQTSLLRRWAREHASPAAAPLASDRKEMVRLSWKSLPNALFFCFQGQIVLLILTFAGLQHGIADISALGRLAALLAVFNAVFANLLIPRFTRCQDAERQARLYFALVGASLAAVLPFLLLAWLRPDWLLWLLGDRYAGLAEDCIWIVGGGCASVVLGTMWGMNSSKGWIHLQAVFFIPAWLAVQVAGALLLDLRQFHDVVIFSFLPNLAILPVYAGDAVLGLAAARRAAAPSR